MISSKRPTSEQVFYESITKLIKAYIVNYKKDSDRLVEDDIKEKGTYILEKIEDWKHLILWEGDK